MDELPSAYVEFTGTEDLDAVEGDGNLCYGSLVEACRETQKVITITHVNGVLVQPHWRSHSELIRQQVA